MDIKMQFLRCLIRQNVGLVVTRLQAYTDIKYLINLMIIIQYIDLYHRIGFN